MKENDIKKNHISNEYISNPHYYNEYFGNGNEQGTNYILSRNDFNISNSRDYFYTVEDRENLVGVSQQNKPIQLNFKYYKSPLEKYVAFIVKIKSGNTGTEKTINIKLIKTQSNNNNILQILQNNNLQNNTFLNNSLLNNNLFQVGSQNKIYFYIKFLSAQGYQEELQRMENVTQRNNEINLCLKSHGAVLSKADLFRKCNSN